MNLNTLDPPVEIETGKNPTASIIWLHGLGADGHDFEPLVPELRLAVPVRFVFPQAPYRPVTVNNGYVMRAWYDIAVTQQGFKQNAEHLHESEKILQGLIENEIRRGVSGERIVLAGFSQGGAIAMHTGLRYPKSLAGIMSLSAPVPFIEELLEQVSPINATVPIFMAHGTDDRTIPFALAQETHRLMQAHGRRLEWHSYPMDHTVSLEEIGDIRAWLARVLE